MIYANFEKAQTREIICAPFHEGEKRLIATRQRLTAPVPSFLPLSTFCTYLRGNIVLSLILASCCTLVTKLS